MDYGPHLAKIREWIYENHPPRRTPNFHEHVHWAPTLTPEPLSADEAAIVKAQTIAPRDDG